MKKNISKSNQIDRKYGQIIGINILSNQHDGVLENIDQILSHNRALRDDRARFSVVTVNPELVLMSQKNRELKKSVNGSTFPIPEAIGIVHAYKFLSLPLSGGKYGRFIKGILQGMTVGAATFFNRKWLTREIKPVKGRVFFVSLIKLAERRSYRVFLLGGEGSEGNLTANNLRAKYHDLKITSDKGPMLDADAKPITPGDKIKEKNAIDMINKFKPHLLFVSFGNPKQEIWIRKNLGKLNIGGAMAVGGTFRYLAGFAPLPPKWIEKNGLEWAWRLVTEPTRIKRILNATIIFPWKVFRFKMAKK
jgi:N-acetylglucosaminyldiphosphoundecaprenol N-acetyl-beta-D-mannosaminyltransferase